MFWTLWLFRSDLSQRIQAMCHHHHRQRHRRLSPTRQTPKDPPLFTCSSQQSASSVDHRVGNQWLCVSMFNQVRDLNRAHQTFYVENEPESEGLVDGMNDRQTDWLVWHWRATSRLEGAFAPLKWLCQELTCIEGELLSCPLWTRCFASERSTSVPLASTWISSGVDLNELLWYMCAFCDPRLHN